MSEHVRAEKRGGVLAITLARPERRNAITVAMYAALADAIEGVATNDAIRLVTIEGEGQDFAAGNDLADFLELRPGGDEEIAVWRFLRALVSCKIPLVAAIHGNCVGIGTTMLLHFDLVAAEHGTRFSLPFVDLGLVPEAASSLIFPRIAGRRRAARYLLLGESFGVEEALEIGLISHIAEAGQLDRVFGEVVERLLAKPREAIRQTQRLLRHGDRDDLVERMRMESEIFSEQLKSDEAKQAIGAFFSRRKPA